MRGRWFGGDTRRLLAVASVALVLVFAGCSGLGGDGTDSTPTPTPEAEKTYPAIYEDVTASVDEGTAAEFRALVTDGDGQLTAEGEQFLETLEAVDELGTQQRDAVVESVVAEGSLDGRTAESLDQLLASPDSFATEALTAGLADSNGDGLLDGEAEALGLDATEPDDRVVEVAVQYRDGGYDDRELAAIRRLAELDSFGWTQTTELGLLENISDGDVTEADLRALEDTSGDGLLDATAGHLGIDADQRHAELADVAATLGEDAFSLLGADYLDRLAVVLNDERTAEQVAYLGLLDDELETVTREDVDTISDEDGDGILNAMEAELGLDPTEADRDVGTVVTHLAQGGYDASEREYIDRIIDFREYEGHDYEYWAQAEELGLLDEAIANGTVTDRQRWKLANDDSDRLLNGIEAEFGSDPDVNDTSGDGYADHLLWGPMQDLGLNVTADAVNVFVEVDLVDGVREPSDQQVEAIQNLFENEPPGDIGPINVRFRVCHTEQDDVVKPDDMIGETVDDRNITGLGFHYLLLSDGLVAGGTRGATLTLPVDDEQYDGYTSWMVVDGKIWRNAGELNQAGTIAHELGHALGIGGGAYEGVDSTEVSADEYASIMNYNYPIDDLTFSTGDPFDDYERMANQTFGSHFQDQSKLEAMWEQGEADEDALC
jgi:hypothetical protein